MTRRFDLVDVYGSGPISGNPLAVVHDAEGLDDEEMLGLTRWFNLSETTFLTQPTVENADYRVRIFTLRGELPFAGHPTLGTCHVWLAAGGEPSGESIVQECGAGLIRIRRGDRLAFAAPPLTRTGPLEDDVRQDVLSTLGLTDDQVTAAEWVSNGPDWIGVLLDDHERLMSLAPGSGDLDIGVVSPHPDPDLDYEVRGFFSDGTGQLLEDPVTGSLNASLGQWLIGSGRAPASYVAAQGTALGRSGRVYVEADGKNVWVGGATETVASGRLLAR